jgi:hypothetical protein
MGEEIMTDAILTLVFNESTNEIINLSSVSLMRIDEDGDLHIFMRDGQKSCMAAAQVKTLMDALESRGFLLRVPKSA